MPGVLQLPIDDPNTQLSIQSCPSLPSGSPFPRSLEDLEAAVVARGTQRARADRRALAVPPAGYSCRQVRSRRPLSSGRAWGSLLKWTARHPIVAGNRTAGGRGGGKSGAPRDGADGAAAASRASPASRLRRASSGCCSWRAALQATGCRGRLLLPAAATNGLAWQMDAIADMCAATVWWAGKVGGQRSRGASSGRSGEQDELQQR